MLQCCLLFCFSLVFRGLTGVVLGAFWLSVLAAVGVHFQDRFHQSLPASREPELFPSPARPAAASGALPGLPPVPAARAGPARPACTARPGSCAGRVCALAYIPRRAPRRRQMSAGRRAAQRIPGAVVPASPGPCGGGRCRGRGMWRAWRDRVRVGAGAAAASVTWQTPSEVPGHRAPAAAAGLPSLAEGSVRAHRPGRAPSRPPSLSARPPPPSAAEAAMGLTISSLFSRLFGKKQMRILMGEEHRGARTGRGRAAESRRTGEGRPRAGLRVTAGE